MATQGSPATSRRWLAEQLRKFRDARGMAQRDAAKASGWSGARLSYLENGQRPVTRNDLDTLLPLYEVPEERREVFYAAVDDAQVEGWWERFDYLVAGYIPAFVGLEQGAATIRTYEPTLIPGVIQTRRYAQAIMESGVRRRSAREVERLVDFRTSRQAILTRDSSPTRLDMLLDESVLFRSPLRDESALVEQLGHLITMAERSNVTLRVVPLRHGLQSYSSGPFCILSFPNNEPDPVVYVEHRGGALWLEDFDSVERYELAFEGLTALALDPEASLATAREAIERQAVN